MSKSSDIEVMTGIFENFPLDLSSIKTAHENLDSLMHKRYLKQDDGTIDPAMWSRLRLLTTAVNDLAWVISCIETEGDPDDYIPF